MQPLQDGSKVLLRNLELIHKLSLHTLHDQQLHLWQIPKDFQYQILQRLQDGAMITLLQDITIKPLLMIQILEDLCSLCNYC